MCLGGRLVFSKVVDISQFVSGIFLIKRFSSSWLAWHLDVFAGSVDQLRSYPGTGTSPAALLLDGPKSVGSKFFRDFSDVVPTLVWVGFSLVIVAWCCC